MVLSKAQSSAFEKARAPGSGGQAVSLSDSAVRALVALTARDLALSPLAGLSTLDTREFYEFAPHDFALGGETSGLSAYDALLQIGPLDTDTYFLSLAALHRARLKYANILRLQMTPSLEQVGPRGLLQYGELSAESLGSLLILRKWMYDIDNRAAQETGNLFEPVMAGAIGGSTIPAGSSPVRRDGTGRGRQVDCLRGANAYEIKIRVTIAASGQGRWNEELSYPADCEASGFRPMLLVLDGTINPKLTELAATFIQHGGDAFIGEDAWAHLESEAGPTMSKFVEKYIHGPLDDLLNRTPTDISELRVRLRSNSIQLQIGDETLHVDRKAPAGPNRDP